ncbi:hypothetical protein FHX08_003426 [Rhizobium sp. BK529]|uniref:hypothetical protein n=1 Tax=unclassified Rhizobium TaxID=2613769 RepID=UPI00104B8901|nr:MULTISPECIES: hypothetical protein [unclassified Rhizobium]MBB3593082.1 hypothetical protein [Rhizobium sp. BK529]TCS07463.1 hypothetical protein EV281_1021082 [Rhizobium sp. BK418]
MTNIRTKGRLAKAALEQHLAELEDEPPVTDSPDDALDLDLDAARKEIAWLRKEVADLRGRLAVIRGETQDASSDHGDTHPWLHIGFAIAAAWVLRKLVPRLRLERRLPRTFQ